MATTGRHDKAHGRTQPAAVTSGMAELTNREQSEMESETSRYVCHACIGDEVLAQQVANGGIQADCNYCSATGTAIDLTELADDYIHRPGDSRRVRTAAKQLRRKLGGDANNATYILNEPRVGYRMAKGETAGQLEE